MQKVTIWERIKKVKQADDSEVEVISHNHIEDGWVGGNTPKPLSVEFEQQKSWATCK